MKKWAEMSDRERDMLVAERIFGQKSMPAGDGLIFIVEDSLPKGGLPRYTTSMDAAWKLVEHFRGRFDVHIGSAPFQYDVALLDRISSQVDFKASADMAPEAICLAFLRTVGFEIE